MVCLHREPALPTQNLSLVGDSPSDSILVGRISSGVGAWRRHVGFHQARPGDVALHALSDMWGCGGNRFLYPVQPALLCMTSWLSDRTGLRASMLLVYGCVVLADLIFVFYRWDTGP